MDDEGTVFELTPPAAGHTAWIPTILHSFSGPPTDGTAPIGGVFAGADGALYGTTFYGGAHIRGTIYRLP